jgi:hypothetical protein
MNSDKSDAQVQTADDVTAVTLQCTTCGYVSEYTASDAMMRALQKNDGSDNEVFYGWPDSEKALAQSGLCIVCLDQWFADTFPED